MNSEAKLSLEQQFNLRSFETQVKHMSLKQAQDMLIQMYEQMLVKDAIYRNLIAAEWGISTNIQKEETT